MRGPSTLRPCVARRIKSKTLISFGSIRKWCLYSGFIDGQFSFNLTGPTGRSVVVEASTDLASWLPLWTNTFAGILNFSDPASGVSSNRFYRAHTP